MRQEKREERTKGRKKNRERRGRVAPDADGKSFHVRLSIRTILLFEQTFVPRYHRTRIITLPSLFARLRSALPVHLFLASLSLSLHLRLRLRVLCLLTVMPARFVIKYGLKRSVSFQPSLDPPSIIAKLRYLFLFLPRASNLLRVIPGPVLTKRRT